MNDHKELMDRLEVDHKARKAELEQELRELVLLVDEEKDKLTKLQTQVEELQSRSSHDDNTTSNSNDSKVTVTGKKNEVNSDVKVISEFNDESESSFSLDGGQNKRNSESIDSDGDNRGIEYEEPVVNPFRRRFQ